MSPGCAVNVKRSSKKKWVNVIGHVSFKFVFSFPFLKNGESWVCMQFLVEIRLKFSSFLLWTLPHSKFSSNENVDTEKVLERERKGKRASFETTLFVYHKLLLLLRRFFFLFYAQHLLFPYFWEKKIGKKARWRKVRNHNKFERFRTEKNFAFLLHSVFFDDSHPTLFVYFFVSINFSSVATTLTTASIITVINMILLNVFRVVGDRLFRY